MITHRGVTGSGKLRLTAYLLILIAASLYVFFFVNQIHRELMGDELTVLQNGISIRDWGFPAMFEGFASHPQVTMPSGFLKGEVYCQDDHPILLNYLIYLGYLYLGWSTPSDIRWIGFAAGVIALFCTSLLVSKVCTKSEFAPPLAAFAIGLTAVHPLFIQAGQFVIHDALLLAAIPLFFLCYFCCRSSNSSALLILFFFVSLATFLSKFSTPIGLIPVILLDGLAGDKSKRKRIRTLLVIVLLALLAAILICWAYWWSKGVPSPNLLNRLIHSGSDALGYSRGIFSWMTLLIKQPARGFAILPGWFGFGFLFLFLIGCGDRFQKWWRFRTWDEGSMLALFSLMVLVFHIGKYSHFYPRYHAVVVTLMACVITQFLFERGFFTSFSDWIKKDLFFFGVIFLAVQLFFLGRDPLFNPASRVYAIAKSVLNTEIDPFDVEGLLFMRALHFLIWIAPLMIYLAWLSFRKMQWIHLERKILMAVVFSQIIFSVHGSAAHSFAEYNTHGYYLRPTLRNDKLLVDYAKQIVKTYQGRRKFYVADMTLGSYLYFVDHHWRDFVLPSVLDLSTKRISWSGEVLPEFSGLIFERRKDFDIRSAGLEGMYTVKWVR